MTEFGIKSFGAYVPRLRLERGAIAAAHRWMAPSLTGLAKGARAFCSWDEDVVTMAVEAARDALGDSPRSEIRSLGLASTRQPYADLQATALVASALGLSKELDALDNGMTQRAGTSGLLAALKAGERSLFIASDAPLAKPASTQEMTFGAGAAAFVLSDADVAARLLGSGSITQNFVDHFREAGARDDYHWEERWIRDEGHARLIPAAVSKALSQAGLQIADINHLAMGSMLRGTSEQVAKKLGFTGELASDLYDGSGYAGAAHTPLMLAQVLEKMLPGERVLVIAFGQGADALIFEATNAIKQAQPRLGVTGSLDRGLVTNDYLRMLSFADGIDLDWGMRSEKSAKTALTEQFRSDNQMGPFAAGGCASCGTIQFPQLQLCVNCQAPRRQFTEVSLADEPAKVMTVTADWLSYHPAPPLNVGFVQFANGARVQMEFVDVSPAGVEAGQSLKMVYRIKERDRLRGYRRYFWKATPAILTAEA